MPFSKIKMGEEELFTTIVQDETGRTLETWKVMKRDFPKVVKILNNKWGLNLIIKDRNKREVDEDLDWTLQ